MAITFGYSSFRVLLLLGYLGIWSYTCIRISNPFTDPHRSGWIAASQLPFLFVFTTKNNILEWLLDVGYQRLNYLHRFLGRLIILAANVHSISYLHRYWLGGTLSEKLRTASNRSGLVAVICFDTIFIFSTSFWRRKAYNVFATIHVVGYLTAVPAIYFHRTSTLLFVVAVAALYGLSLVLRLMKTRIVTATIRPLPSLSATRIEIPKVNSGWRAGQHVRVRILSMQLGRFGWAESHPFTIASAPVAEGPVVGDDSLTLICKKTGTWTAKLFEMAKEGYLESGFAQGAEVGRTIKIMIEGPYGGTGHTLFASCSAVVMVVGGSGVTFALSAVQSLVQDELKGQSHVKVIELVWMIRDRDAAASLIPLFTVLTESCPYLTVSIFCTRGNSKPNRLLDACPSEKIEQQRISFRDGRPGRTGLAQIMESVISRMGTVSEDEDINGMLVGICGPPGLGKEVRGVVNSISSERQSEVGGVEIHEEVFGW
ncbi:hypothetical protein APHAL10511_000201 [Amanita phalloides]|nr:hypothetical protein APHAL10511_000201 [Amanita phalloides]